MAHYNTGFKNGFFVSRMPVTEFAKSLHLREHWRIKSMQHEPSKTVLSGVMSRTNIYVDF